MLCAGHNTRNIKGFRRAGGVPRGTVSFRVDGVPILLCRGGVAPPHPRIELQDTLLNVVAFILVLAVVSIATVLIGKLIAKLIKVVMLGWLDKLLGIVFALLCTAVILGVLIVSFDALNTKFQMVSPERLDSTVLYSSLRSISWFLFPYLKELIVK